MIRNFLFLLLFSKINIIKIETLKPTGNKKIKISANNQQQRRKIKKYPQT